jgi:ferredoxin
MKITVDLRRCTANGVCMSEAPDVFLVEDGAGLKILEPEPGEGQREVVENAVAMCPTMALQLEQQ